MNGQKFLNPWPFKGCLLSFLQFLHLKGLKCDACVPSLMPLMHHAFLIGVFLEQSVVFKSCNLAGDRHGSVHCFQAV